MKTPMKTPLEAFMEWFDTVPRGVREVLAHLFQVSTTEDTSVMAGSKAESLARFRHWVIRPDFPMRIASRMFYVRSVFDMVVFHHKEILSDQGRLYLGEDQENITDISLGQWEKVFVSWGELRQKELADSFIHSWASWMIKMQTETV